MKNYTQVYVKNSLEAAEFYCKAFGAEITRAFPNADGTAYEHCELSVNGEGFLALAEAANPCDVAFLHKMKWAAKRRCSMPLTCCGRAAPSSTPSTRCRGAAAAPR